MRIFVIARGYPTKQNPQWGCFEKDQAVALAQAGHEVVILSYRQHPFIPNWGYQIIEENGIHALSYNFLPGRLFGAHGGALRVPFEQWELRKAYKRAVALYGKPDIIYSHYLFVSHIAVCLHKQYNIPIVLIEHWSELQKKVLPQNISRMAKCYEEADTVIAVSQSLQKALQNHFNINSRVVYNMVGSEFAYKAKRSSGKVRFVATGSLIHRKGYDLLIKASAKSKLPKDQWQLAIIGSGAKKTTILHMIEQEGLQDNISLTGQKSKLEIAALYQQSDIFVLPSRSETFGVVYIEAIACGLPVIATPCGGPEEFVDKNNGILVPINDINNLAKALEHMFYHHREYDRQAIALDCQSRFAPSVIARQLTAIFEDCYKR